MNICLHTEILLWMVVLRQSGIMVESCIKVGRREQEGRNRICQFENAKTTTRKVTLSLKASFTLAGLVVLQLCTTGSVGV